MTTLKVQRRNMETKAKKLRREGYVTGNLFGKEIEGSIPLQIEKQEAERIERECMKGSQQTTQEIEIYFNFVGRYLPPHFGEVQLTTEEEEELRKREARKDRLHQNYLRRKANGKQKEYEDKVKEKRKAEIEAKKEAIRQEDIAKGVFVPVSMLPAAEPKKGVANA